MILQFMHLLVTKKRKIDQVCVFGALAAAQGWCHRVRNLAQVAVFRVESRVA